MNKNILLCGVGGQGTVLASKLIAAAAMQKGEIAHSAETIGMAQRGGSVTSHVRIGNEAKAPLIPLKQADLIISFEPAEAVRNIGYLKEDGIVIVNSVPVCPTTESLNPTGYDGKAMIEYLKKHVSVIVVDSDKICETLGSSKFFNVAILGVAFASGRLGVEEEIMRQTIESNVPAKFIKENLKAFELGMEYAK